MEAAAYGVTVLAAKSLATTAVQDTLRSVYGLLKGEVLASVVHVKLHLVLEEVLQHKN